MNIARLTNLEQGQIAGFDHHLVEPVGLSALMALLNGRQG